MRTSDVIMSIGLLGLAIGLSPTAVSFDGTRTPRRTAAAGAQDRATGHGRQSARRRNAARGRRRSRRRSRRSPCRPRSAMPPTPQEAFRSGTQALRQGKTDQGVMELEYAAEQGVPGAIWKLGRMYADGDGVKANKARAYEYFRRLTTSHADESAGTPNARFLANAFVTLGAVPSRRHPRHAAGRPECRARDVPLRRVVLRRSRRPSITSDGSTSSAKVHPRTPSRRRAGCGFPPTRAITGPRLCWAACCSRASRFRGRPRLGLFWLISRQGRRRPGRSLDYRHVFQRARPGQRKRASIGS